MVTRLRVAGESKLSRQQAGWPTSTSDGPTFIDRYSGKLRRGAVNFGRA